MVKLRLITQITDEELLKLVEENPQSGPIFEYKNDIMDFISTYNLKQGKFRVPARVLFKLYKQWSKDPIGRNTFAEEIGDIFGFEMAGVGRIYLLNREVLFLKEEIEEYKKTVSKTKMKKWGQHFNNYLNKYKLKNGRFYIKDIVLYNLYDKWVYKIANRNPLSFHQFLRFCRVYFTKPEYKRIDGRFWFGVNKEIKEHLTEELIKLMKKKE